MNIKIHSIFGTLKFEGDFSSLKECVLAAIKSGANLCGANLFDADLRGADLFDADLRGANLFDADLFGADLFVADLSGADMIDADLRGANLCGADLCGADLFGVKIKSLKAFSGLYRYQVFAILATNGKRYVKMGCLFKSLEEWEKIGILKSNESEFPDDGSRKSLERKEAFEFARNAALNLE
jgi:hypothetical protein